MDFLNEQDIYVKIVDPAITRLNAETIPALKVAFSEVLADAIPQLKLATGEVLGEALSMVHVEVAKALESVQTTIAQALLDVQASVRSLNGATLTSKLIIPTQPYPCALTRDQALEWIQGMAPDAEIRVDEKGISQPK